MDVYRNKEDREKYLERYYTEAGVKALENRLDNLIKLFIKDIEYPFSARMYGFGYLYIHSKAHLEGMIENLKEILYVKELIIKGENNDK